MRAWRSPQSDGFQRDTIAIDWDQAIPGAFYQ